MNDTIRQTIQKEFGDRATSSPLERELYSRDLGPVPAIMADTLFRTSADLIVRPTTTQEIASLVKRANAEGIPLTPRAGGSTVFFNSVPAKGGIIIDMNGMSGVVSLDEAGKIVKVKAATTWSDLEDYLNERGLACKSMPSSAPAATIGGWLCMMGYGIGSLKYGGLMSQVKSVEVVLPDGNVKKISRTTDPSLEWFEDSEGTLGIVTEIELEARALTPMKHFLLHLSDDRKGVQIMNALIGAKIRPYNLHFSDVHFVQGLKDLGLSHLSIREGGLLIADYEGSAQELAEAEAFVHQLVKENASAKLLPESEADLEWEERYKSIRIKRGGPAVLGGEMWLPVAGIPAYLEDIRKMAKAYHLNMMSYAHIVSPERATAMTLFAADERKVIQYILGLSLVKKIQDIGYRHGGCPYGIGLWNTPYLSRLFTPAKLKEIRQRKKKMDPRGIMNPGKVYSAPFMMNPLNFTLGMEVFALIRRIFGRGW